MKSKSKTSTTSQSEVKKTSGNLLGGSGISEWWACFAAIVFLNMWTRFHKIAEPAWVCWDETHFGKMGSW